MHDDRCTHQLDAGAYALGALEEPEAREYAVHLAHCIHCRSSVEQLGAVVAALPIAAPQVAPPPALKSRIMATVTAEAELLRAAGAGADRPAVSARPRLRERLAGRLSAPLRPAFAGLAACVLLALGVAGGLALRGSGTPETRTLQAYAQGPATAKLEQTGDKATLELAGVPSLNRGEVYQVWLDRGDGIYHPSRTIFNVRRDGRANVAIEESVKGVDRIAVTRERSGGALTPSQDPVITASPA